MKDGFVRAAVGTPAIRVADCPGNARNIIALMREAEEKHVKLLTLPELCVTGYTASDLLLTRPLLEGALSALEEICKASETLDVLTSVGVPLAFGGRLYNCAAFVKGGRVLGVTATAPTLPEAIERAYAAAEKITFTDRHMRHDIGQRALKAL